MTLSTAPMKTPKKTTVAGVKNNFKKKKRGGKKKESRRNVLEGKDHPGHLQNGEWIEE